MPFGAVSPCSLPQPETLTVPGQLSDRSEASDPNIRSMGRLGGPWKSYKFRGPSNVSSPIQWLLHSLLTSSKLVSSSKSLQLLLRSFMNSLVTLKSAKGSSRRSARPLFVPFIFSLFSFSNLFFCSSSFWASLNKLLLASLSLCESSSSKSEAISTSYTIPPRRTLLHIPLHMMAYAI